MAPDEKQVIGSVRTQDLSVSWVSEPGTDGENTDRVCILTMANGQIRLTMQSASLNLRGMRLTKGHICVFALFEARGPGGAEAADKASETFINEMMKYDITKKPAPDILKKCLSKADRAVADRKGYKASITAFASKEMTACCANGGKVFVLQDDGKVIRFTSDGVETLSAGTSWKSVMMVSDGYRLVEGEIKEDMHAPMGDLITKREMRSLPATSSVIRVQRL